MKVSVFGLGYVGAVSCACLPELGHDVVGVDINPLKVELIASGQSPVVEEGIEELIAAAVKAGKLSATRDVAAAVRDTEISLISVATPSLPNYMPDLTALDAVVGQIGAEIAKKGGHHTLVIRSTVAPGTTRARIAPLLEKAAGRKIGDRLSLVFNPEFLREGSSVADFHNPPQTIVGSLDEAGVEVMKRLYTGVPGNFVAADVGVAESVKYLCNVFHALKIVFANEAGAVLKETGLDSRDVLELFCRDTQLNISKAYLRPGFAFGGSCLPKEVKGFLTIARERGVDIPVLGSLLDSNDAHIGRAYDLIAAAGRKPVALFGLAFKPGTDDLREAPSEVLIRALLAEGAEVVAHDPMAMPAARRRHALWSGLRFAADPLGAVAGADALVIATEWPQFANVDLSEIKKRMRTPLVFDGRNLLDPESAAAAGLEYHSVGRPSVLAE
jgi:GDP-mannose 6-dehydrogenase